MKILKLISRLSMVPTCLIPPSYREGLSKTVMEAMYSGLL